MLINLGNGIKFSAGNKIFIFSMASKSVLGLNQSLNLLGTCDSFLKDKTTGA
jgi:hypothetical protein